MKLSEIDTPKDCAVDFGGGNVLNITYRAALLTPKLEDEMSATNDSTQMVELVRLLVTKWDLTEDDGETIVPLTTERLASLPLLVVATTIRALAADIAKDVQAQGKA